MKTICFEMAKRGEDLIKSEDSIEVKQIGPDSLMVVLSDGASTGVFSSAWSNHITSSMDSAWLSSEGNFTNGLAEIRRTFKPDIKRPTALRKFLLEGSYATLYAAMIKKTGNFFIKNKFEIQSYCIGDVTLFIFNPDGELEYSFYYNSNENFNNSPDLFRSNEKLQKRSPFIIHSDTYMTSQKNTIVFATDALSEFIFKRLVVKKGFDVVSEILECLNNEDFYKLMTYYRDSCNMKNDDIAICVIQDD
jgi:hypothetical protein